MGSMESTSMWPSSIGYRPPTLTRALFQIRTLHVISPRRTSSRRRLRKTMGRVYLFRAGGTPRRAALAADPVYLSRWDRRAGCRGPSPLRCRDAAEPNARRARPAVPFRILAPRLGAAAAARNEG